ncbi:hypothetical protein NDU88_002822 [Pleurodeles waltl]|uniref:Uncharacterized protein n=1 Tax=Pleurodeles waltl TaxID=8319 RepID=A0AAV7VG42_PLEWA|nr:hypothetical protein NDU88_002822 [Pleurodeles waltl]
MGPAGTGCLQLSGAPPCLGRRRAAAETREPLVPLRDQRLKRGRQEVVLGLVPALLEEHGSCLDFSAPVASSAVQGPLHLEFF